MIELGNGLYAKIKHRRFSVDSHFDAIAGSAYEIKANHLNFDPRGGSTAAYIYDKDGKLLAEGFSFCSDEDNFNYKLGRDIAIGRALKELR